MSKPYIWNYGDNDDNEKSIPVADDQITRDQQEDFMKNFAVDFFNDSILGKKEDFLTAKKAQPDIMYGFNVKTIYNNDQAVDLIDPSTTDEFQAEGASVEAKVDSWFFKDDEILIDTITSGKEPYGTRPLINIKWDNRDHKVTVMPKISDFSKLNGLTFNLVTDSADELNHQDRSQQFTVALRDTSGNTSNLVLAENLNA